MSAAAVVLMALVADEPTMLRNAPEDSAQVQATLVRGDWLEVRGEVAGFLKVYDHRHERPGYVRPRAVRVHEMNALSVHEVKPIVLFLRDASGFESLGIAYAALALRAAGLDDLRSPSGAAIFLALGEMADRLGRRLSLGAPETGATQMGKSAGISAAQIEVVKSYGVTFLSAEIGTRTILCYDGDAFERVLAHGQADPNFRARAALSLVRNACRAAVDAPLARKEWLEARLRVLERVEPGASVLNGSVLPHLAHRIRMERARALSEARHDDARSGQFDRAAARQDAASRALALIVRGEIAPEDRVLYDDAAVRVASGRSGVESAVATKRPRPYELRIGAGRPGETCVRVVAAKGPAKSAEKSAANLPALAERCTYGVVLPSSARWAPGDGAVVLSVEMVSGWTELWLFQKERGAAAAFQSRTLTPAPGTPGSDIGYVEPAGFSPDGARVLIVREARVAGRFTKRFELVSLETLAVEKWASHPERLLSFKRWASPRWKAETLALR